jgi:tetratricopeptide (TPR) repeat protein
MWAHPQGFATSARSALLSEDTEGMLAALSQATVRDPTSVWLHRFAAFVFRAAGRYQDCLEHLAEASAIAPGRDRLNLEMTEGDAEWVDLEGLRRRLDRYPRQRVSTELDLARELKRRGHAEEGLARLKALLPEPRIAIEIARWELEERDVDSAAHRLEPIASRRVYPASLRASAWALLAEARDMMGDGPGASEAARQALKLAPDSAAPYLALAALAERRRDYETALSHLRRAWGIAPTNVGLLLRVAAVAERAGKAADARLALERAVEVDPSSPDLAVRLVDFQLRHGRYMEAALRLSKSLDRFPTDDRLLGLAQRLRREVGRVEE